MAAPVTLQQLVDAGTDATTLAAVVNGPASGPGSTVISRLGLVLSTLAAVAANIKQSYPANLLMQDAVVTPGQADANGAVTSFTRDTPGACIWFVGGQRAKQGKRVTENGLVAYFDPPVPANQTDTVEALVIATAAAPVLDVLNFRDSDPATNGAIVPVTVHDGVVTTPYNG